MEIIGFIFGIIAFAWCASLNAKVSKMKRMLKDAGFENVEKESLKDILEKNKGKVGVIAFEEGEEESDLLSTQCVILDIDSEWVLVELEKKKKKKLIRVESISTVTFVV